MLVDNLQKNKERIQKCKGKGDWENIYQIEIDKAYFEHDMVYINFKDLTRRTASHKILRDKVFNIGENPKYDGYQRGLASVVHKFFDAKTSAAGIKNENMSNEELEEETHKPIIRKFKKRKLYSPFIYNIQGADLADVQLISKVNKGIRFLLCGFDIFSKYAWVIPLKDKEWITITNAFQKILEKSNRIPNIAMHLTQSMKSQLQDYNIQIYSTHNEGKSVAAEIFIRILKKKIHKYMTSISKGVYLINQMTQLINTTIHIREHLN